LPSAASATATTERPRRAAARYRPYVLLFLGLSVVYHSNLRPIASGDSLPSALIPLSVVLDGSIRLDRFGPWLRANFPQPDAILHETQGHFYSWYPIAGPVLASPLYLPLLAVPHIRQWQPGALVALARILEKFTASAYAAGSAVVLLLLLERLVSRRWAWILTLVYALGTAAWSTSSQALWQHGPGQFAVAACLYSLERWWADRTLSRWIWLCGVCAGVAIMIRPPNIVLLPGLALALLFGRAAIQDWLRTFTPAIVAGLVVLIYNLSVFQSASGAYVTTVERNWIGGLSGILFSPGRGLLVYTPVALFALFAFSRGSRAARAAHLPLFAISVTFIAGSCLIVAAWPKWWGGYCWGPRMLSEILPPVMALIALGAPVFHRASIRRIFAATALYGCAIQAIGVYFYPNGHWDNTPVPVDSAPGRLWNWKDNPISRTIHAGPVTEPYSIIGAALKDGIPAASRRMRELNVRPY
jgi:hypothetical protein